MSENYEVAANRSSRFSSDIALQFDTGSWSVNEDQFCREWKTSKPRRMCLAVVSYGSKIQLFDSTGLMVFDARIVEN